MKIKTVIIVCIGMIIFVSAHWVRCTGGAVKKDALVGEGGGEKVRLLLEKVDKINKSQPRTFRTNFTIEGSFKNKKKFKSLGTALYNNAPRKLRVSFIDFVFRSPLTVMIQDGTTLKFYFPVEKKLYVDSVSTIELKNYVNLQIDFGFLYQLIIGNIPLINNYRIKNALNTKENKKGEEIFVILENENYYETISFKKDIPNKIMVVNKATMEKTEIYLGKPFTKNGFLRYRNVKFISQGTGDRIIFRISGIKFNVPMNIDHITKLKLARNTKIYKM